MNRRRGLGWLAGILVGMALGGAAIHLLRAPPGPPCLVRGRALGPVRQVVAVQSLEGFHTSDLALDPGGEFQLSIPQRLPSPWIVIHGPGGSMVRTAPLAGEEGLSTATHELATPLALWVTPFRVLQSGEALRFEWAPIPAGEGFPRGDRRWYSLLVDYPRRGEPRRGESVLRSVEPWMEITLRELLDQMPDLIAEDAPVRLELRAYDLTEKDGALWVGASAEWRLGSTELTRPD